MKEYDLDYSSLMGGWYIPDVLCDNLIDLYHEDQHYRQDGSWNSAGVRDEKWKKSTEIYLYAYDKRYEVFNNYLDHLNNCLEEYKKNIFTLTECRHTELKNQ